MGFTHLPGSMYLDVIAIAVVLANAFFVGSIALAKLTRLGESDSKALDLAGWLFVATTFGLGLIAWITLPLGLILPYDTLLYRSGHAAVFIAGAFWWHRSDRARLIRLLERPSWRDVLPLEKVLWVVIGLTGLYATFLSLHSVAGWDAQTLHLKAVLLWEETHSYVAQITGFDGLPHTVGDEQTQSGRLLFLHVALLGNISASAAFNFILILLGCGGIYSLGAHWFSPRVGRLSVLFYLTNPVLFRYFLLDASDYPLNLNIFLALCIALSVAVRSSQEQWLSVAAILAGLLYGVKAYSVLQMGLLAVIILPFFYRLGWLGKASKQLPWFGLFVSPWLIHHWVVFGNPVWPHLNALFGGHELSPFWVLWSGTRPYFMLQSYFDAGCATYGAALVAFWWDQLFPAMDGVFAFSVFLMPSIGAFTIAAWWRRIFVIPLVFAVGFLAVTLNTPQLFNKYMILVAAPLAPFLAFLVQWLLGYREKWLHCIMLGVGVFGLFMAWDAISWNNRDGLMLSYAARTQAEEPLRTLNNLPQNSVVFGNFVGMDNRYTRTYWHFRYLSDTSELLCDDWEKLWAYYKQRGVTHYLVQKNSYDEFYYASALPYVDKMDPPLAVYIRKRQLIFEQNREKRNQYLEANANLTPLPGGYLLYELR
jgi:hypothetical protein